MQTAFDQFEQNLKYVEDQAKLFLHLKDIVGIPLLDMEDILRAQWVSIVSAMDKLLHELIRIGMIDSFLSKRSKTPKFLNFTISLNTYQNIQSTIAMTTPPPEWWFEQEIIEKHKALSFQAPDKIVDGLSLIWDEKNKWAKISVEVGMTESDVKSKLKTIVNRRNQIAHEADLDLFSGTRNSIQMVDIDEVYTFIKKLSTAIFQLVK